MNRLIRRGLRSLNSLDFYRACTGRGHFRRSTLDKLFGHTAPATLGSVAEEIAPAQPSRDSPRDRTTHLKPMWHAEIRPGCPYRAAGR